LLVVPPITGLYQTEVNHYPTRVYYYTVPPGAEASMDYLRTPDERFERLPGFQFKPHYLQNGDLRIAYIDERNGDGSEVFLCLRGEPTWSYLYRKMIPVLLNYTTKSEQTLSRRVVAPDFFGFGRSDKPRQDAAYNFDVHRDAMVDLIESLNLTNITLVVQEWGGLIGLTLPITEPRLIVMNTTIGSGAGKSQAVLDWIAYTSSTPDLDVADLMDKLGHHLSEDEKRAYRAPFPDDTYKGGVRRFPRMILIEEDMPGVEISKKSRHFFETTDNLGKETVFVVCGMQDPILGPHMKSLAHFFRNGCYYAEIEDARISCRSWAIKSRSWRLRSLRTMAIPPECKK